MKRLTLIPALVGTLLVLPSAFAGEYIPWHWDDVEDAHTVVQHAEQPVADDAKWTSDIGW